MMVSRKQKERLKAFNIDIEKLTQKTNNEAGIVSLANSELLDKSNIIDNQINISLAESKVLDTSSITKLSNGKGLSWSKTFLTEQGYDTNQIDLQLLLSSKEIIEINREINRPLTESLKWDKWDYIFVFIAAVMGSACDFFFGDPNKGLSKYLSNKNTKVGGWFEQIHILHEDNNPMDYQGYKMGGGNHRQRSIGHDLFGFLEGIMQIKNGTFTGGYFEYGKWVKIVADCNQYGKPYAQMSWDEAIWNYTAHVFCDFFSTKSLPVPGFGYLSRMSTREIRIFSDNLYANGYNLRHMFVQALSIACVEIIIRVYSYIKYYKTDLDKESIKSKQRETRLLAHALVSSFNIGKVIITQNPLSINFAQILFTCYQIWPLLIQNYRRNNRMQLLLRNLDEISDESEAKYIDSLSEVLSTQDFGTFFNEAPIKL
jgi:hypothetical protein